MQAGIVPRPPVRAPARRYIPPVIPVVSRGNDSSPASAVNKETQPIISNSGKGVFIWWLFICWIVLLLALTLIVTLWIFDTPEGFGGLVGIVGVCASIVFAYKWAHSETPPSSSSGSVVKATPPALPQPADSNATQPVEIKHPAKEAFDDGRYRDAILIYEGMLYAAERRSTKNADRIGYIHWLLGRSYSKLNEHDKALEHFFQGFRHKLGSRGQRGSWCGLCSRMDWI